jgi:hypothetical protein
VLISFHIARSTLLLSPFPALLKTAGHLAYHLENYTHHL